MNQKGFTLIELITVITIIAMLSAGGYYVLSQTRAKNLVKTTAERAVIVMEKARSNAMHGKNGSEWCADVNSSVLVVGQYDSATPDVCPVSENVRATGISFSVAGFSYDDVVIFKKDGSIAKYNVSRGDLTAKITIDAVGGGTKESIDIFPNGLIYRHV